MLTYIDSFLDRITMYRVILYYLLAILAVAAGLSVFGRLPDPPFAILGSVIILLAVCGATNYLFSKVYAVPANVESSYITALILACILPPLHSLQDLPLLGFAAALAMGSKYILAIRGKHIFNPVAIAAVLTAFWLNQSATWWVGTPLMVPIILIGGLLVVRKLRRFELVITFFVTALAISLAFAVAAGGNISQTMQDVITRSPLLFFMFAMLTEPLTSPTTSSFQILFAGIVGLLFAPQVHFGTFYLTPELALIAGNAFSYVVSPKIRERLTLTRSHAVSSDVVEFDFTPAQPFPYAAGQYMEFTLPPSQADSRGNRRYFTLASSPTEDSIKLGIKFYPGGSSFKRMLRSLVQPQTLIAGQLSGDFILPTDPTVPVVLIAGGIGVTPFRSMLKYLSDINQKRDISLFYIEKTSAELAYTDIFAQAEAAVGAKIIYSLTGTDLEGWTGQTGRLTAEMIQSEVLNYKQSTFYISGPHAMVKATEKVLQKLGIQPSKIKRDFFPGLA